MSKDGSDPQPSMSAKPAKPLALPIRGTSLWLTLLGALFAAVLLLVAIVLPAEYSLDPLGTGRSLGLLGLADGGSAAVVVENKPYSIDRVEFELAPFESVEYSYRMVLGSSFVFSWQANEEVVFNLHSSPDFLPPGAPSDRSEIYSESFSAGRSPGTQGTYKATFTGRHGWFWENRTNQLVTLRLSVSGFVEAPLRSSVSGQEERQLAPLFGILKADTDNKTEVDRGE